jgi:hypothetical protein
MPFKEDKMASQETPNVGQNTSGEDTNGATGENPYNPPLFQAEDLSMFFEREVEPQAFSD